MVKENPGSTKAEVNELEGGVDASTPAKQEEVFGPRTLDNGRRAESKGPVEELPTDHATPPRSDQTPDVLL